MTIETLLVIKTRLTAVMGMLKQYPTCAKRALALLNLPSDLTYDEAHKLDTGVDYLLSVKDAKNPSNDPDSYVVADGFKKPHKDLVHVCWDIGEAIEQLSMESADAEDWLNELEPTAAAALEALKPFAEIPVDIRDEVEKDLKELGEADKEFFPEGKAPEKVLEEIA